MPDIRRVIAYSGLDYHGVLELPTDVYLLMLKNSVIDEMNQTKEGRERLELIERLQQTEPDKAAIRAYNQRQGG